MFYVENIADRKSKIFTSSFKSLWWTVVTLTTVGYGDMYPETTLGYIIGSAISISGLFIIAVVIPMSVGKIHLFYQFNKSFKSKETQKSQYFKSKGARHWLRNRKQTIVPTEVDPLDDIYKQCNRRRVGRRNKRGRYF